VKVDELFGVYSFKQVHQLISTVSCNLKEDTSFTDIIKATFPMGSMTGAPKVSAMKWIEKYESTKRGLYSGSVGYIMPNGDFDFNVVIRSIIYNSETSFLSFMVGSAITAKANAEMEYDECMLKAKAMFEVLQTNKK
jgi:para-aminobenzoate synthetase component 1